MKTCDWCGKPLGKNPRTGAGEWYNTCSEGCRVHMVDSIRSGKTAEFRTPFERLIKKLMPLVLVALVFGFISKSCSDEPGSRSSVEQTTPEPAAEVTVEETGASETQTRTARHADELQHAVGTFGEPGQFESTSPSTTEPTEPSEPASGENIQTIPAPESDSARKASETAF